MAALDQKNLIIVGGTTGMGLSATRACARAGARLVVIGRDPESVAAVEREFPGIIAVAGDAEEPATINRAIALAVQRLGELDGLYHVAGGSGRAMGDGPLHEIAEPGWDGTLNLNLRSVFLSNRAAVRQFLQQGKGGTVLNITSVLGFAPAPHFFYTHAYAASKAAVIGLTRSCAAYYAKHDIRFNAIAPALTDTPMARRSMAHPGIQQYVKGRQPLDGGRPARPEDLDAAVVFLLSDGAKFVTGQVLAVDGGWSVSEGLIPEGS